VRRCPDVTKGAVAEFALSPAMCFTCASFEDAIVIATQTG
jgi:hypothetical protein